MKVSIITIVYNNKEHIKDCIEAVIHQDYNDIEHIVIDGGSIDGTQGVIENYKTKLSVYISEKDSGLYNALNKGIKKASGDIIGILHSDDLFNSNETISNIVDFFYKTDTDVVYSDGVFVDRKDISKVKRIYKSKPFKKYYLNWGWIPLHTGIYLKKNVIDKVGLYNESYQISSDYDYSIRLFKSNIKINYLNQITVKMRLGGKSTTTKLQKLKSKEDLGIIRRQKLMGYFTLFCKVFRKIPQYLKPIFMSRNI